MYILKSCIQANNVAVQARNEVDVIPRSVLCRRSPWTFETSTSGVRETFRPLPNTWKPTCTYDACVISYRLAKLLLPQPLSTPHAPDPERYNTRSSCQSMPLTLFLVTHRLAVLTWHAKEHVEAVMPLSSRSRQQTCRGRVWCRIECTDLTQLFRGPHDR